MSSLSVGNDENSQRDAAVEVSADANLCHMAVTFSVIVLLLSNNADVCGVSRKMGNFRSRQLRSH